MLSLGQCRRFGFDPDKLMDKFAIVEQVNSMPESRVQQANIQARLKMQGISRVCERYAPPYQPVVPRNGRLSSVNSDKGAKSCECATVVPERGFETDGGRFCRKDHTMVWRKPC